MKRERLVNCWQTQILQNAKYDELSLNMYILSQIHAHHNNFSMQKIKFVYLKLSKFKSYVFFIQYRMWKWATWCQGRSLDDSCCRCKYRQPVLLMLCCGFKKSEIHCLNEMRCHETRSLTCFSVLRNCLLMLYGLNYESAQDFDFGSLFEEK